MPHCCQAATEVLFRLAGCGWRVFSSMLSSEWHHRAAACFARRAPARRYGFKSRTLAVADVAPKERFEEFSIATALRRAATGRARRTPGGAAHPVRSVAQEIVTVGSTPGGTLGAAPQSRRSKAQVDEDGASRAPGPAEPDGLRRLVGISCILRNHTEEGRLSGQSHPPGRHKLT
jgi:hypothetical protein